MPARQYALVWGHTVFAWFGMCLGFYLIRKVFSCAISLDTDNGNI